MDNPRVSVVAPDGEPLMPTKASRARRWIKSGKAMPKRTKEGIFYVQLVEEPSGRAKQPIVLAVDPGSGYDGYTVAGCQAVILQGMAVLPQRVKHKMTARRMLRRNRRYRKCRCRPARFDNRTKKEGWIAPSQLAKVQLRLRIIERLCKIVPVSHIIIEDVKFNHYQKRWGKHFSTVEIGKQKVYARAQALAELYLFEGWHTATAREVFGIPKSNQKDKLTPESHANDAWALACHFFGKKVANNISEFYVWRRQEHAKRQLHRMNPLAGNKRRRFGGTTHSNSNLRKGDRVEYKDGTRGYVGGWTRNGKVINLVGSDGKRIRQASYITLRLVERSPNILVERRKLTQD